MLRADGSWAVPWPAEEVLAWAWQRWEVEGTLRALKMDWGVGAAPCWLVPATVCAAPVQVWSDAVGVLAGDAVGVLTGDRAWGEDRHPARVRPAGLWWPGGARGSVALLQLPRAHRQARALAAPAVLPGWAGTRGPLGRNRRLAACPRGPPRRGGGGLLV